MLKSHSIARQIFLFALVMELVVALVAYRQFWAALALTCFFAFAFAWWMGRRLRREAAELSGNGQLLSDEFRAAAASIRAASVHREQQLQALADKRLQLEVLLEGMQDGVLGVDAARRVEWTNAEMGRILDKHGLGAVIRLGRSLAHSLRDPALLQFVEQVFEQRTPASLRTSTLLPGRIFDVNAAPLPNGGAVLVLRDVTRTEAMERAQREFVANVSHELRTPLTSVRGYAETLLDSGLIAPEAEPWVEIVLKNVERMSRLTEDLLVLARTEAPDRKIVRRPIAAGALLREAVQTFAGQSGGPEARVLVEAETHVEVLADEIAVLQVLGNLLENAAKYGRPLDGTEPRIHVATRLLDPETVRFSVRDFGSGIALEHQSRIFERFYRVDKARSRESGGTGLGLSIARHLVEENGGKISVESNMGEGTEFRFTLPVAAQTPETLSVSANVAPATVPPVADEKAVGSPT